MTRTIKLKVDLVYGEDDGTHELVESNVYDEVFESYAESKPKYRHGIYTSAVAPGSVVPVDGFTTIDKIVARSLGSDNVVELHVKKGVVTFFAEINPGGFIVLEEHDVAQGDMALMNGAGPAVVQNCEIWMFGT